MCLAANLIRVDLAGLGLLPVVKPLLLRLHQLLSLCKPTLELDHPLVGHIQLGYSISLSDHSGITRKDKVGLFLWLDISLFLKHFRIDLKSPLSILKLRLDDAFDLLSLVEVVKMGLAVCFSSSTSSTKLTPF